MQGYTFDSHVHSENSFDGKDSVISICEFAIANDINGLAITDHCEVNDYKNGFEEDIRNSHRDIRVAQEIYKGKLDLKVGIELGQPLQDIETAEKIIKEFPCDFIIGSMHNVQNEKDFHDMEPDDFKVRIDSLLLSYYKEYYDMVKWGMFDVIGHITYPLRYVEGIYKMKIDMNKYNEIIYEMLKIAVSNGIGIEVNVSGFRQPYGKQFPNIEHIKAYKEYGGEIITIGTDSHTFETIGMDMDRGKELLRKCGFKYYSFFEERQAKMIPIL